jgi:hypothetical protein
MKILIEKYHYPTNILQGLLPDKYITFQKQGFASVELVGYYNNFENNETILILPKIFEEQGHIFSSIVPESFVNEDALTVLKNHDKTKTEIDFIYRFALVFYLSLREFQNRNAENTITSQENLKNIISNIESTDFSELDLIFSLLRFYQENRELILFKQKMAEKQHFKKTNWAKTIHKQTAILQDDLHKNTQAMYLQTSQKEKLQDNENELLSIFFTVLHRFRTEYGFNIHIDNAFAITKQTDFDRKALRTLKQIRHQYFQDKFKKLLTLLLAYFEKRSLGSAKTGSEEFLLCQFYNIVFEDMIDKLLSDTNVAKGLKEQGDGKIVDHIFEYGSLFKPDSIFYIGDSKYYKDTTNYSQNSIFKQHTYAKNVIQYNINLFNEAKKQENLALRYRDTLTEGYNITPNFFIQGYIDHQNLTSTADNFRFDVEQGAKISYHFKNRIFDRDTLFVLNFKINFIFVLQTYIEKDNHNSQYFSQKAKEIIKKYVWDYLKDHYDFYLITPKTDIETFVNQYFRLLHGKIYRTSEMENSLILGLEKQHTTENKNILKIINMQEIDVVIYPDYSSYTRL